MPLFSKLTKKEKQLLKKAATQIRIQIIKMIAQAGSGHPAGSLGMSDVFTSLYGKILCYKPQDPDWPERDFLILSNGHICPVLYASLAQFGIIQKNQLKTLRQLNSPLEGHPHKGALPGIETSSGPLGQGVSQAAGLALGLKRDQKNNHVFCISSDGEQQEGQVWEAYQFINKYQLDNLTIVIDRNQIQIEGQTHEVMPLEPLADKLASFGFKTKTIDGHNFEQIISNLKSAKDNGSPTAIITQTVPGKGVSFMQNKSQWHGKAPSKEQMEQALEELEDELKQAGEFNL